MCTLVELAQFITLSPNESQAVNLTKSKKSDFFSLYESYLFNYLSPLMEATSWAQIMNLFRV